MINWKDSKVPYNPIRDHIKLGFKILDDPKDAVEAIAQDLVDKNFDKSKSRVLIFVRTRNQAEELSNSLNMIAIDRKLDVVDAIDFYHAGLDGITRTEKYESFKKGDLTILIATKAFGMGMDIENIHFIYHFGPSSTFEDYLQEVGRAGRNQKSLEKAGFSSENPIHAKCLMTQDDFNKIKDIQHKNQITWSKIEQVRSSIFDYVGKFRKIAIEKENAFSLPLDLLDQIKDYDEVQNKNTLFRIILYWLEKLQRIKLGVYSPSQLPIKIINQEDELLNFKSKKEKGQFEHLRTFLKKEQKEKFDGSESIMVGMQRLKDSLEITKNKELFKVLFRAQKMGLIILERYINLEITKNRTAELKKWRQTVRSPRIESTFAFAERILSSTILGTQVSLNNEELEKDALNVSIENLGLDSIFWKEESKKGTSISAEKISEDLKKDFKEVRSKFAFKILNYLSKIKHKSHIEYEGERSFVSQLIYNGNSSKVTSKKELDVFKRDLQKLISFVSNSFLKSDQQKFNIVDLINKLNIEEKGEEYLQQLIFISKGLGYLKGMQSSLIPMGIELFIYDTSTLDLNKELDLECHIEFEESNKMKSLRLLSLKCLSDIDRDVHDSFIKSYFQCASIKDLMTLLSEYLDVNHPDLRAYREEALKEKVDDLNDGQRKVYKYDINKNLQVVAGPGTGKTHTLTLRIAKLIQEDKIDPERILVLAYNRAVVIELKDRLRRLFKDLGYAKLISRLRVFTFHGLVKYALGSELKDLEFKHWVTKFLDVARSSPGTIRQNIGKPRFVFVDEFQDITNERLDLLKFVANPDEVKICVIGDPNQSIYGYERVNVGGPMSPQSYYETFTKIYSPEELELNINYRSYIEIIKESEKLLSFNKFRFRVPELLAHKQTLSDCTPTEIIDFKVEPVDWKLKLQELLRYKDDKGNYRQIAIMFRSNNEVYRAFNKLKALDLNVRLRIQGANGALIKTREFYHLLEIFRSKADHILPSNYLQEISDLKLRILKKYSNWDIYLLDVFDCLVREFEKEKEVNSTYEDLLQFVEDIGRKDDGQFGKIYEKNISKIGGDNSLQEVVITTMHKVKGLEFDAVLIPPSFSNLPTSNNFDTSLLNDYIEEERRLYYVAYSRAKKRLVVIKHDREESLENGVTYEVQQEVRDRLGVSIEEGIDKFKLYWNAEVHGANSFNFIKNNVKIGDSLLIEPNQVGIYTYWHAIVNGNKVAQLSSSLVKKIGHNIPLKGFSVSSVYVHTYEETLKSDQEWIDKGRPNEWGRPFAEKWIDSSRERGFVYVIDFSGYGRS
ncbi:UvrD-helicase domain-containing protein [Nonlabens tegetincola]|uniref:UvrD-helicase domain-containing protein n=1 Tax=Nonlabens tegetincola TaxID=323273 RepID=UPI000CF43332|nr:UvrD-helicase domain-containing protein [Nonlabens tegetincola]PQJ18452.1 hypothetical protein BST93_08170 [Nonlabens tegetincola]